MKSNWFLQKQQCDPQRNVYTVYFQFVYSYRRYDTIQIKTKENKKNQQHIFMNSKGGSACKTLLDKRQFIRKQNSKETIEP